MSDKKVLAPEFPASLEWLNVDAPVKLTEQRGKIVILHFWCYSNTHCFDNLAELEELASKYREDLTVIGIFSPLFSSEKSFENAQKSIQRFQLRHACLFDPELKMMKRFGIPSTPAIVYINDCGEILGMLKGSGRRRQLEKLIQNSIQEMPDIATHIPEPVHVKQFSDFGRSLSFPGNVLATNDRLFISDSGHHRIIEVMLSGRILRVYGTGSPGYMDAVGEEAGFNNPQGLAYSDDKLYVADMGNHCIRVIDIVSSEVTTIAGTGKAGKAIVDSTDDPLKVDLNAPNGIRYENGMLFIAMQGLNQIWQFNLGLKMMRTVAGTGVEGHLDGDAREACLAQTSAVAVGRLLEPELFFVDAVGSSLRTLRLRDMRIKTLFGFKPKNFGFADGDKHSARLQYPMDVIYDKQHFALWIADTFNNKIRHVDLHTLMMTTAKIDYEFNEPSSISMANNSLWIANTNEHEIVKVDMVTGDVTKLDIFSVEYS